MAFESVVIRSVTTTVPAPPVDGSYREDLVPGDLVSLSLLDLVTGLPPIASSYKWQMVGRPERAVGGGGGPLPITMATTNTTTFTVDADAGAVLRDGTYNVACILNEGLPTERRISVALVRDSGLTIPDLVGVRTLRRPGGFESLEDTQDPNFLQGWARALNRWLEYVIGISAPLVASDRLLETLSNSDGIAITQGMVVCVTGNSACGKAQASAATPLALVGVVQAASIAPAASGLIATHGLAAVQFNSGIVGLAAGKQVYASEVAGYATTTPPDGSWIAPLGVLEDAMAYNPIDPPGTLLPVKIQIPAIPPETSRVVSGFGSHPGGGPTTILTIPLRDACAYVVDVDVALYNTLSFTAGKTTSVTVVVPNGGPAFIQGGPTVAHLGDTGTHIVSLTTAGFNLLVRVQGVGPINFNARARLTGTQNIALPPPPS